MTYKPGQMTKWVRVAAETDCPPGATIEVVVQGDVVALFNVDGMYYALDGVCPHQGGPLGQGELNGCILTCPWHGWQFNVRNGQHEVNPEARHRSYQTKLSNGEVFVAVDSNPTTSGGMTT